MAPNRQSKSRRKEFRTGDRQDSSRPAGRKLLQRRLHDTSDAGVTAGSHGDEPSFDRDTAPPREDRAG